jgi:hypothetical protein
VQRLQLAADGMVSNGQHVLPNWMQSLAWPMPMARHEEGPDLATEANHRALNP